MSANDPRFSLASIGSAAVLIAGSALLLCGCASATDKPDSTVDAQFQTALMQLNDGPCLPGQTYAQEPLREPVKIGPVHDRIRTQLVVRIRDRCVPVWVATPSPHWEMQTLKLRTYGFPRDPGRPITRADADDPNSPSIAWSAPGPTFVMRTATKPGASDGTRFKMRLYNRMPHDPDPHACDRNLKCNTKGQDAGVDPATGRCKVPPSQTDGGWPPRTPGQVVDGKIVEPPNCFHGDNSTNFHFHGFHVSPQRGQDDVLLELRPPKPPGVKDSDMPAHGPHGEQGMVAYGQFDFDVDPLRYTQAPGTHWYHAHKHGSTALQVLNGLVGTFEVRGAFDRQLERYFEIQGGGKLGDRLLVVQQLQEKQPGLGGADQNGSVLVNGQANPIVTMAKGEIQRWRFVGATMQASAALRIGFPDVAGRQSPKVRQIAMDGVQFSPENYACQPFLRNPDCSAPADDSAFDELTAFNLNPGNRVDVLVQAPPVAGRYCLMLTITTGLNVNADVNIRGALAAQAAAVRNTCGVDPNTGLGPLFTLVVEDRDRPMRFPEATNPHEYPVMPPFLADIPKVTDPALQRDIYYEMVNQGNLPQTQFWINQEKFNSNCANETLTMDVPEQWTLWNNSAGIAHPFHIHQNPFQLLSQSDRRPSEYKYPIWRDTMPIPKAPAAREPNSDPRDPSNPWGHARILYVAKEFTGAFVNHCHILGHEDRGMMHNTQASCADGNWARTGPVKAGAKCDAHGFCPSDCATGRPLRAMQACPVPPPQTSDWPAKYGYQGK